MKSKKQSVMFPLNFNSSEAETNRCSCLSSVTIALKFRTSHWTHTKSTQLQHWQIFSAEVQGLCSEQREAPQPVLTRTGSLYQPPLFLFFFFPQAVILHFVPCSLGGILWPFCNDSSTQWQSTCECREVCKESGFTVKHPRRGFSLAACMHWCYMRDGHQASCAVSPGDDNASEHGVSTKLLQKYAGVHQSCAVHPAT